MRNSGSNTSTAISAAITPMSHLITSGGAERSHRRTLPMRDAFFRMCLGLYVGFLSMQKRLHPMSHGN